MLYADKQTVSVRLALVCRYRTAHFIPAKQTKPARKPSTKMLYSSDYALYIYETLIR